MKRYAVKEVFGTIQGEGANAGRAAVFVRLAGCNLWTGREEDRGKGPGACSRWCDTDFVGGERMTAGDVFERARAIAGQGSPGRRGHLVVVTGGEPLLQVDDEFFSGFNSWQWSVAVETNGTVPLACGPGAITHLTVSPKKGGVPYSSEVLRRANELKVVLPGDEYGWSDDELFALEDKVDLRTALYVQPQASPLLTKPDGWAVKRCVDFVHANPRWRLSVQVHKMLSLP